MNNKYGISDYRRKAVQVREAFLTCYDFHAELSTDLPAFIKTALLRAVEKEGRREQHLRTMRGIAAAIAVILLLSGILLATNAEARAKMIIWLKTVTYRSAIYEIEGAMDNYDVSIYRLREIPEGFTLCDSQYEKATVVEYYLSENGSDSILFQCRSGDANTVVILQGDKTPLSEDVSICGFRGEFYPADMQSGQNNLIWFDEENGIIFTLDSTLDRDSMLRMAESIYD